MRIQFSSLILSLFVLLTASSPAFAQIVDISLIASNISDSIEDLPGLVSTFSYILGILFGVRGILKLKAHVENPGDSSGQTPLRTPIISFIAGGALFALPLVLDAASTTIDGNGGGGIAFTLSGILGGVSTLFGGLTFSGSLDFNAILANVILSIRSLPGLITAFSYLLGLVLVVSGVLKAKEHVDMPEQTKISESVIRLLTGGALLTMPTIYSAMFNTIDGTGGLLSGVATLFGTLDLANESGYDSETCTGLAAGTIGALMCETAERTGLFPAFLTAISYLFGLVMGVWGVLKIRDHVLNPQQTGVFEGISRLMAGGAFFALPVLIEVFRNTLTNGGLFNSLFQAKGFVSDVGGLAYNTGSIGACPTSVTGMSLDVILLCFTSDILTPINVILTFFAFVAGIIFIMIGISRLIKGAQEGAKAPGGLGTIMTFLIGGALISYNDLMRAATQTLTGNGSTLTYGDLNYTTGMTTAETEAAHAIISSIVKFMIVIGIISFVRGLFIVRNVAEGNQQASMMAGVTHIVGGALAVNIGPVINAVQATLGTTGLGVTFS